MKAINVSELAMHHTAVLIDRWHQESVPFFFSALADTHIHPKLTHTHARTHTHTHTHTHTAVRTPKKHRKGGEGSYSRTTMSEKRKNK